MIKVPDFIEERLSGYPNDFGVKSLLIAYFGNPDGVFTEEEDEWLRNHLKDLYLIALGVEYYANDKYYINVAKGLNEVLNYNYVNWDNEACNFLLDNKSGSLGFQTQFTLEEIGDYFPQYLAKDDENEYYFLERVPEDEVA